MSSVLQNFRFGLRLIWTSPAYAAAAVITIALGIGATTAIFSIVYHTLLAPLPYPEPDRLVVLQWNEQFLNGRQAQFLTEHTSLFASTSVTFLSTGCNLTGGSQSEYVPAQSVTPNLFRTLQIKPMLGRDFVVEDAASGTAAMISYRLWRDRFNSDRTIVGKAIRCNGAPFTVVGVLPPGLNSFEPADVWTTEPLTAPKYLNDRGANYLAVARLQSGVPIRLAQQRVAELSARFRTEYPAYSWGNGPEQKAGIILLTEWLHRETKMGLMILFCAVGVMLVIGVANVSGLMLVRTTLRRQEIATRVALGASRGRLFSQLITEALALNVVGGALGVAFANLILILVRAGLRTESADMSTITINWAVLLFAVAITAVGGIAAGLLPAWHVAYGEIGQCMKRATSAPGQQRSCRVLVVAEVAFALVLLSTAAILMRGYARARATSPGFDYHNLYAASLSLGSERYQTSAVVTHFLDDTLERLSHVPGMQSAAEAAVPMQRGLNLPMRLGTCSTTGLQFRAVTPSFFSVMRIPLRQGRTFTRGESAPVVIVNELLARTCFDKGDALGKPVESGGRDDVTRTVVGIVGNTHEYGLGHPETPVAYVPVWQVPDGIMKYNNAIFSWSIVTRAPKTVDVASNIRQAIQQADSEQPVIDVTPVSKLAGNSIRQQAVIASIMTGFGLGALVLSISGLYSLLGYYVTQRTREIGIRMALGANRSQLVRMVLRGGAMLVLIGAVIGSAGAVFVANILRGVVPGMGGVDPVAISCAVAAMIMAAALSAWLPARRAAKVEPIVAVRYE